MVTIGKGLLGVVSGGDPAAVGLEGVRVDTVVVAASTARRRSSQQKLNSLIPSRMHSVDKSNGRGEGEQLSEMFNEVSIRL